MTWVNLKKVEAAVEHRIMVLINARSERGMPIDAINRYFEAGGLQSKVLEVDIPGWLQLAAQKRKNRVNKVIRQLVLAGRARIVRENGAVVDFRKQPYGDQLCMSDRLIPLNVLDKIVFALENDDAEEAAAGE